ncbi:hypothetical protein FRC04_005626 [Tulasnella sp. 424]|nr:hypothetical protein FRC04_005626 [Tulasnella sp. 424]
MGMNQLWRPALLDASRVLRQNVVQGRIWGFGSLADEISPSPPSSTRISSTNDRPSIVAKNTHMPSVPSTVFEDFSDDGREAASGPEDRYEGGNGWIGRGMLTRSVSSLPASTSSRGKVRDMVANFERSASESSASENEANSANEISPFDFGSSNETEETVLSPVHDEAISFSAQARRPLQDDIEAGGDEAGFASGELTSGSEAGDEDDEEDDGFGGDNIKTVPDKIDSPQVGHAELDGEEIDAPAKDEDSSKESDSSPTSSSLPQTPPPVYETHPIGLVTPSETEMTLHEDETSDDPDSISPKRHTHSRSPSSTLMLTSSQRRNPSFVAQISHDSGSDDTVENLIADFTASELEQHPLMASWGANAWLDDNVKEGATARKIQEPVYHSLSRRTGKAFRSQESSSGSGSSKLMSLFEDPALDKKTVDVSVDASQPEETVEAQKIKVLEEKQVQQQAMLDEFRSRLEEVERRLEEMESKETERSEREREAEAAAAKTQLVPVSEQAGEVALTSQGHPPEGVAKEIVERDGNDWKDPTIGGLPSYVFLVGLGVAAICMRVVVKRVAGRRTPGMLGFL